jgi:hypothetical protein
MSFAKEDWKPTENIFRGDHITHMFSKPNLGLKEELKEVVPFVDYHANEELPCVTYERAAFACINQFGFMTPEFLSQKSCITADRWLKNCVQNYNVLNFRRKYSPERRLDTTAYQPVLHIDEVV